MKEKKISPQPKILYAVKLSFKSEGKLNTFSDRQKLREFTSPEGLSLKKNQERLESKKVFPRRRKLIQVRISDLHKRKAIEKGLMQVKYNISIFLIVN